MIHGSRVLGAVSVYSERTGAFDAEELGLLKELATDLAFALQSIEHEQERKRAEESLREKRAAIPVAASTAAMMRCSSTRGRCRDCPGQIHRGERHRLRAAGLHPGGTAQNDAALTSARRRTLWPTSPGFERQLAVEKSAVSEGVHLTKDGRRIPVEISTHVSELNGKPTRLSTVERHHRAQTGGGSAARLGGPLSPALRVGQGRHSDPRCRDGEGRGRESLSGRVVGFLARGVPREEGLGAGILQGRSRQPGQLRRNCSRRDTCATKTCRCETSGGRQIDVEFVSNVYLVNQQKVIQCNIRDITERKRAELRIAAFASLGRRLNAARTAREAGEIIVSVADDLLGWDACLFDLYSAAENRMTHLLSMDLIDGRRTECQPQDLHRPPRELGQAGNRTGGPIDLARPSRGDAAGGFAVRRYVPPLGFDYVRAGPARDGGRRRLIHSKLQAQGLRRL